MVKILLYIWQLPQNLLGLIILLFLKGEQKHNLNGINFYYSNKFYGGISLGRYIILSNNWENSVKHEYGHCIQSKILGPLYLLIVGLPSITHAWLCKCRTHSYYDYWCEKWADKLGKVKRK